jgi:hypothetical protein
LSCFNAGPDVALPTFALLTVSSFFLSFSDGGGVALAFVFASAGDGTAAAAASSLSSLSLLQALH